MRQDRHQALLLESRAESITLGCRSEDNPPDYRYRQGDARPRAADVRLMDHFGRVIATKTTFPYRIERHPVLLARVYFQV